MLDLGTQLRDYLDATAPAVELEDIVAAPIGDANVRPIRARSTARPVQAWMSAAAAAIVILLLVGGMAWLLGSDEPEEPATTVPTTVTPTTVAPTTVAPTTLTPTTTVAAAPVVPPGEGPKFSFIEAVPPSDGDLGGSGEWFDGSLFVLSDNPARLFRSSDGFTWASVPGFPGSSGDVQDNMLQADDDRLVNVVIPESGGPIRINVSTNGEDWLSSAIDVPMLGESNGVGEFRFADESGASRSVLAVGPQGIVVATSMTLVVDAERSANSLLGADEGVHVELLDIDLDRGVMTVQHIDERSGERISEVREIDLNSTGFGRDFTDILKAMAADPDWAPAVDGIVSTFTSGFSRGYATAVVNYAWFSTDGVTWQRVEEGPFDGTGKSIGFSAIVATSDGFVATASRTVWEPAKSVWESTIGTVWTEATDLIAGQGTGGEEGRYVSSLDRWNGELVELATGGWDTEVWTLTDPSQRLFSDIPTHDMTLVLSELGLIGATNPSDFRGPGTIEVFLSVDGTSWSRWEPSEFGPGEARARIVGVGDDFVVIQIDHDETPSDGSVNPESYSFWVGTLP